MCRPSPVPPQLITRSSAAQGVVLGRYLGLEKQSWAGLYEWVLELREEVTHNLCDADPSCCP